MVRKRPKPYVIKRPPVTQEQMAKILKLSPEDVARINALVEATPGLHDSNEEIIRRHQLKSLTAGS